MEFNNEPPIKTPRKGSVGKLMFFVVLLFIIMSLIASFMLEGKGELVSMLANTLVVTILAILLPTLLFISRSKSNSFTFYLNKPRANQIIPCILFGIGLCFAALVFSVVSEYICTLVGIDTSALGATVPSLNTPLNFALSTICICFFPAVCEELLCRSAVLYSLKPLGMHKSAFLSGLFFALLHANPISLPMYILLGYAFGIIAYKTRSVYSTMIVHFVYNFSIIMLNFVSSLGTDTAQPTSGNESILPAIIVFGIIAAVFLIPAALLFIRNCKKNDLLIENAMLNTQENQNDFTEYELEKPSHYGTGFMIAAFAVLFFLTLMTFSILI